MTSECKQELKSLSLTAAIEQVVNRNAQEPHGTETHPRLAVCHRAEGTRGQNHTCATCVGCHTEEHFTLSEPLAHRPLLLLLLPLLLPLPLPLLPLLLRQQQQ